MKKPVVILKTLCYIPRQINITRVLDFFNTETSEIAYVNIAKTRKNLYNKQEVFFNYDKIV